MPAERHACGSAPREAPGPRPPATGALRRSLGQRAPAVNKPGGAPLGSSAGLRGALLIAVAVVIGAGLLAGGFGDTKVSSSSGSTASHTTTTVAGATTT